MDDQVEDRSRAAMGVGMRFRPTQQELLWLLRFKVEGGDISEYTDHVLEKNLYGGQGTEPWKVFGDIDNDKWCLYDEAGGGSKDRDKKRIIYVITKLSKIGRKKTTRTAGIGTWDGQTQAKDIYNYEGNKTIGSVKFLSYEVKSGFKSESESEAANRGYWYMHEYLLSKDYLKEVGINESSEYVICRVIRYVSKSCQVKASSSKTTTTSSSSSSGKRKKNVKEGIAGGDGSVDQQEQRKRAKLMQMNYDASVDESTIGYGSSSSFPQQQQTYNNIVVPKARAHGTNINEPIRYVPKTGACDIGNFITPQVLNLLEEEEGDDGGGLWSHFINLSDKELAQVEESWKSCLLG